MTFALTCETQSKYCIEYSNGTLHDVWTFEFVALVSVVVAIGGYLRASKLHKSEHDDGSQQRRDGALAQPGSGSEVGIGGEHAEGNGHNVMRRNENGVST